MYLDYEGPISEGRGHVSPILRGVLEWIVISEFRLIANLRDRTPPETMPDGRLELTRLEKLPSADSWLLTFFPTL
jgi:hypothetical protein